MVYDRSEAARVARAASRRDRRHGVAAIAARANTRAPAFARAQHDDIDHDSNEGRNQSSDICESRVLRLARPRSQ